MISPILLISILIFICIISFIFGIYSYVSYQKGRRKLIEKIQHMGKNPDTERSNRDLTNSNFFVNNFVTKYLLKILHSLGNLIKPKNQVEISHLRKIFLRAGYRSKNATVIFFGVKIFLAILLPTGFSLLKLFIIKVLPAIHFILFSLIFAFLGFYLPNLWLKLKLAKRKRKLFEGFPNALDLLVVCVEAGLGLDAAISRVGEEIKLSNKVVSDEFKLLSLELRAGKPRMEALRNLAVRTDLEDVSSLVNLLIQTDKFGTSLAQALRVHSDSMRTKRFQKAEEIASKLPVKLVFPLVLFILPALLITAVGPAVITIARVLFPALGGK